jgi:hypothetical protein
MFRRTAGVDVIGNGWFVFGWRTGAVLALVPGDVALGFNTPLQDVCASLVWRGVVAGVLISFAWCARY